MDRYRFEISTTLEQQLKIELWPRCSSPEKNETFLEGLDADVSAERIMQRVIEQHSAHRFREFVSAVEACLKESRPRNVDPGDESPSTADELEAERVQIQVAVADAGDCLISHSVRDMTCTVVLAKNLYK